MNSRQEKTSMHLVNGANSMVWRVKVYISAIIEKKESSVEIT